MRKRHRSFNGLIALNVVLVAVLGMLTLAPSVEAEGNHSRSAGDYLIIGGSLNGSTSNAIYLLEQRSGALVAFLYDRSAKKLKGLSIRSVAKDAENVRPSR